MCFIVCLQPNPRMEPSKNNQKDDHCDDVKKKKKFNKNVRIQLPPSTKAIGERPRRRAKKAIGKISIVFLLLIMLVLFVAIRGRHNEMMYMALTFAFFAIALFSYGYWSAVNRGDGIWQYIGPNNLQHQQMSNPKHHLNHADVHRKKSNHLYLVTPPKMGGVKLEIYTPGTSPTMTPEHSTPRRHSHHHHRYHNHNHNDTNHRKSIIPHGLLGPEDFYNGNHIEPVKCEVQLPQKQSKQYHNEDFQEVILPILSPIRNETR